MQSELQTKPELVGAMHKNCFDDLMLNYLLVIEAKLQGKKEDQIRICDSQFTANERRQMMVTAFRGMRTDGYAPIIRGSMILWEDREEQTPITLRSVTSEEIVPASQVNQEAGR